MSELTIGQFLLDNPNFVFHLREHIESMDHISGVRSRVGEFLTQIVLSSGQRTGWPSFAHRFQELVHDVPAFDCIDTSHEYWWREVAPLAKSRLAQHHADYLNPRIPEVAIWRRTTSGTTGEPIEIQHEASFFFDFQLGLIPKVAQLIGVYDDASRASPIFCVSLHDRPGIPNRVWTAPDHLEGLYVRPHFDKHDPNKVASLVRDLLQWRPPILTLKPSILRVLVCAFRTEMIRLARTTRLVFCSGQKLDADLAEQAIALGLPLIEGYGLSEAGMVAAQCNARGDLHVFHNELLVEVEHGDSSISFDGEGEILVSVPRNAAMPLIRYRTGDLGSIRWGCCPCGRIGQLFRFKARQGNGW